MKPRPKKTAKTSPKVKSAPKRAEIARPVENPDKGGRPTTAAYLPKVAESIAQAAELLKWPEAVLKQMKKAGAPGFRFSRVYFDELLPWIGQRGIEDPSIDWADRLKRAQAKREEIRLAADERRMVDRDEIIFKAQRAMSVINSNMDRVFRSELPAALKGLEELAIAKKIGEAIDRFKAQLSAKFEQLAHQSPEDQTQAEAA